MLKPAMSRFLSVLAVCFLAITSAPSALAWDPVTEAPTDLVEVKNKCTTLGMFSVVPSTFTNRFKACLDKCLVLDPSADKAAWESSCCSLASPLTVLFPSSNQDVVAVVQSIAAFAGPLQKTLLAKCEKVRTSTGSGTCVFGKEIPPGGSAECCVKETANTLSKDVGGSKCVVKTYSGGNACTTDNVYGCCICMNGAGEDKGERVRVGDPNRAEYNCQSCKAACASASGVTDGVPDWDMLPYGRNNCPVVQGGSQQAKTRRPEVYQDMFCFTQSECARVSAVENWKPGHNCPNKGGKPQGYCRSPDVDYELQYPIFGIKTVNNLKNFVTILFNVGFGLALVAAAVMFVWGGFKYMVSAAGAEISSAKTTMIDALVGMCLALGAYAILSNVNPATLIFKPLDVDMINRLSFYDVVYCKSITPTPKLSDAGTPDSPIAFETAYAAGFNTSLKDTKCGHEYFIEGSSSQDLCMGSGCGGGVCVNCTGKGSAGCKNDSATEHACLDAHLAGNVMLSGPWDQVRILVQAYCYKPYTESTVPWNLKQGKDAGLRPGNNYGVEERILTLSDKSVKTKGVANAAAEGDVGNYAVKFNNIGKTKEFFEECKSKGMEKGGMLIGVDLMSMASQMVSCVGCAPSSANRFFVVNKNLCGQDLMSVGQPEPGAVENQRFIANLANNMDLFYRKDMAYFDNMMAGAWTAEEIESMKTSPEECSITAIRRLFQ